jgi:hypothetical protein
MEHASRYRKPNASPAQKSKSASHHPTSQPQTTAFSPSQLTSPDTILALQRTYGNARVQRFLEDGIFAPVAAPASSTVGIVSAQVEVVPLGTPGNTTATLTITGLPKRKYKLTVEEVESKGHSHTSSTRPLGTLSKKNVTTDAGGSATVTYTSNIVGGKERITITDKEGTDTASCDLIVRVPDLQVLPTGTGYELVGQTATHPDNHFGTADAVAAYQNVGTDFDAVPTTITPLIDAIKAARATATPPATGTPAPKPKKVTALTTAQIADHLVKADQTALEKLADSQLEQLLAAVGAWGLLGYNDMSLEWGGIFDIKATWAPPHATHRTGQNMDFRLKGLTDIQKKVVEAIMKKHNVDIFKEDAAHWHLTVT